MTAILFLLLSCLCTEGGTATEEFIARLERVQASITTPQGVSISTSITNVTRDEAGFAYRQLIFTKAPAGTYKVEAAYRIPFATLTGTSSRIEETGLGSFVKFIVEAPAGKKPFHVTVREYSTGAYANNTNQGVPNDGAESYFGFTFATKSEAEEFKRAWAACLSSLTPLSQDSKPPKQQAVIIGSAQEEVEQLLVGWRVRKSNRSTASRQVVYYIKDVEVIVSYQGGKAVGVAVIDKPGAGISPIPQSRFDELVALISGEQPKSRDVRRDGSGIREFSVGDAD